MAEILTWEEITQKFYGEWLLIVQAELDETLGIIRGQVIAHSPNQDEIYNSLQWKKQVDPMMVIR